MYILNDGYKRIVWDLVRVTKPSSSDPKLTNNQNQSPLYLDWWASVINYRPVYFLQIVRR